MIVIDWNGWLMIHTSHSKCLHKTPAIPISMPRPLKIFRHRSVHEAAHRRQHFSSIFSKRNYFRKIQKTKTKESDPSQNRMNCWLIRIAVLIYLFVWRYSNVKIRTVLSDDYLYYLIRWIRFKLENWKKKIIKILKLASNENFFHFITWNIY